MTTAVYPGTFDPPTNGHLDLIRRASRTFDKLIVAVGIHAEKHPAFTKEERLALLRKLTKRMRNVTVKHYDGLLVDFVRKVKARTIIRGIRTVTDFEYEFQLALMNRNMAPEIETVFIMPAEEFSFVSSSLVKQAVELGADMTKLIPRLVQTAMKKKLSSGRAAKDEL
ncbi:MAG: pantetheine-phosphate adenylyltransferase [Planctomycetota bacterium]|nr:MAG: pantetheine-phosphate adenylyltransferase [Planctomycetota bacterium]